MDVNNLQTVGNLQSTNKVKTLLSNLSSRGKGNERYREKSLTIQAMKSTHFSRICWRFCHLRTTESNRGEVQRRAICVKG